MIQIDATSIQDESYSNLQSIARQIQDNWGKESGFFHGFSQSPNFIDKEERQAFSDRIQSVNSRMERIKPFITSYVPGNEPVNYPSKLPEEKRKALLIEELKKFRDEYEELHGLYNAKSDLGRIEDKLFDQISLLEERIFKNTEERLNKVSETVIQHLDTQLKEISNFNSQSRLSESFGDNIEKELKVAKRNERSFMCAFVVVLFLIPYSLYMTETITSNMKETTAYVFQGSLSVSLLVVSLFFFSQYRNYMLIRLRYSHLHGFLGGGATFVSKLINDSSPETKQEINTKLVEMFMSLDDVLKMVQRSKHPTEISLETFENVIDKVSKFRKPD